MNRTYALPEDDLRGGLYRRIYLLISKRRGGWQSAGAAFGLAGGLLSIPLALLSWAAVRFLAPAAIGPTLNVLSNVFFALALPLLALGACCLDLLERKPPAAAPPAESRPAGFERRDRLRPQRPRSH
jgi:hypothetical protein